LLHFQHFCVFFWIGVGSEALQDSCGLACDACCSTTTVAGEAVVDAAAAAAAVVVLEDAGDDAVVGVGEINGLDDGMAGVEAIATQDTTRAITQTITTCSLGLQTRNGSRTELEPYLWRCHAFL
jgi:hypothetical protein